MWQGWEVETWDRSLREWYQRHGRALPWRKTTDPYAIWVSEIMLQQTQVKTVIPYYYRWLERFPDIPTLANSPLQLVLKQWEGLGYYARARNLHRAAQKVVEDYQGVFPDRFSDVLSLPGIGRTTAGGILSAAFNQPISILDGNVKRVLARLVGLKTPPKKAINQLWELSDRLLDRDHPREYNQALMDLGATICTPKQPSCLLCPWRDFCYAFQSNLQTQIPMREPSTPLPHKQIGVAVIWNDQGEVLIDRRLEEGLLGGLWEFPGGKIEANETIPDCIKREIKEELGISIEVGDHLITLNHAYTHFRVTLNVYHCRYLAGEPQPIECEEIRWVKPEQLSQFPFPKANTKIIDAILNQFNSIV
ncbi:A/G-specific adenine glycosylase [Dactylococcopsis salina]|uniref:Adenine DNA glycosylase n=1 Tax=Dactylococcopsis salina (strain PCC 8305) TaxID=13035 RepID=K9YWR6_DACS8|nr:A/G-specific adenine glycosylase [Dactylococcopsis salina]AFZ50760.1 A/G-specific adenine glycosylase [Dactylococcopsis salina PCC 8305]